ncbi:transposon Ty3-I Gag-Pol polyprotein [Nephila pilipes]|uniref:Transposon Ty3-I Gag-Pol polyprotein n=1 Tax=Nephila pilipes TaxID=299642 RepID=A0A8X6TT60_NEPPI|nr:transposon Ty3-I Gag-Pol polyprotein [Nephila pilipes]
MLLEISSRLSRLETRERSTSGGPEGRFRRRSSSREFGAYKHCWYHRCFKERATKTSRSKYLIDTGADVSVILLTTASKHLPPASLQLFAANGTIISTYGSDFLRHYGLLVDIRHSRLVDSLTKLQKKGTGQQENISAIKAVNGNTKFHRLLAEFPSLVEAVSTPQEAEARS